MHMRLPLTKKKCKQIVSKKKNSFFWNHHLKLIASSHSDDFKANSFKSQWWFQKNDISLMLTILDTLDTFSSSLFWTYFWENNFMDIFCTRFFVHFFDTFFLHFFLVKGNLICIFCLKPCRCLDRIKPISEVKSFLNIKESYILNSGNSV